ncbi:MAG: hypothetical protein LBO82_06850 [Synergistaceae bacterium]|nr:hypothetical protein [Synergistaceae bacterium]
MKISNTLSMIGFAPKRSFFHIFRSISNSAEPIIPPNSRFSRRILPDISRCQFFLGARLDRDPLLFFTLRGIDFSALLKKSVDGKIESLLKNAGKKSRRVIDNADIAGLFGV